MKNTLLILVIFSLAIGDISAQESDAGYSKYLIGFSAVYPTGTWPATALSNMGTTSFLQGQDHKVKSYGFGVLIQRNITKRISLFSDINLYSYNIFLASQGEDVQSVWTVEQSALHWDEPDAPQILYVHNLPTDVTFDMQSTGIRLGGKFYFLDKKFRPWCAVAAGYYKWTVNYYNGDQSSTYGNDSGYVPGITYLLGVDFKFIEGMNLTLFADLAAPVAKYNIEGLFYPQWDIEYSSHIMGTTRFGLTLSFDSGKKKSVT